ncbi:MAG: hypothetical protein METHAR1v1_1340001 [Methanothrix sp.]|nr:MAG: hypothetical protein METHAR1v1_1340001 [Methanothrix sp.]
MPATSHIILRSARWTKLAAQGRQEDRGRLLRWGDGGIFKRPEDDGEPFEEKMQRLTAEPERDSVKSRRGWRRGSGLI